MWLIFSWLQEEFKWPKKVAIKVVCKFLAWPKGLSKVRIVSKNGYNCSTLGEISRGGHPDFWEKSGRVEICHPESRDEKVGMSLKLGKVEDIPTLPDFRLKIRESRDWPRFILNCPEISKSRIVLPDPDLSKSWDGHSNLDLDPTQFLSRYYPPRDISLMVATVYI